MRHHPLAATILALAAAALCRAADVVRLMDFHPPAHGDAMPALRAAVEQVQRTHAHRLELPPGRVELYPDGAFESFESLSNHDSGSIRMAIHLQGLEHLTIAGQGTQLVFHGRMVPILLEDIQDLRLEGFSIDWATPFNFQGTVTAADPARNQFDLQVLAGIATRIDHGQLVQTYDTGEALTSWRQNLAWSAWFRGLDGTMEPTTTAKSPWTIELGAAGAKPAAQAEDLGGGRYRLRNASQRVPHVGWILASKGDLQAERTSPAIYLLGCRNAAVADVTVYHAGGMAFIADFCTDVRLDRFQVRRPPGSDRIVSSTADGSHFVHCRGQITLSHCYFENMLDDGTNVHGAYLPIVRRPDERTLVVRYGHYQQEGARFALAGDRIGFSSDRTLLGFAEATLAGIETINRSEMILHFSAALPAGAAPGAVVDNRSCQPDVRIEDTTVRNNRARGFMIKTAGRVSIVRCQLIDSSVAPVMGIVDDDNYCESGPIASLEIRDCTVSSQHPTAPVFLFHPVRTDLAASHGIFDRNLRIVGNHITCRSGRVLEAWLAQGITVADNDITCTGDGGPLFAFRKSEDITIARNRLHGAVPAEITADAETHHLQSDLRPPN